MTEPSLLLLIPAYNEESRIEPVLREYARYFLEQYKGKFQIVVVLNGCRDNTLAVVQRVAGEFPCVQAVDFPAPIGKGGALIEGLRLATSASADVIGYVDADGASPPRALHTLVDMTDQADAVIGSRWLPGARLHQAQPWLRRFTSRCFHLWVELWLGMHIKDTQCPCKALRCAAVERIHSSLRIADLAFDVNLIYALKHAGFKVIEVPTEWTDKAGSKVTASLFRSSMAMALSVFRVWLIHSPKIYNRLRPLRPLEGWVYRKLRQPQPLPNPLDKKEGKEASDKSEIRNPKSETNSKG